jgi:hypothetical protein
MPVMKRMDMACHRAALTLILTLTTTIASARSTPMNMLMVPLGLLGLDIDPLNQIWTNYEAPSSSLFVIGAKRYTFFSLENDWLLRTISRVNLNEMRVTRQ